MPSDWRRLVQAGQGHEPMSSPRRSAEVADLRAGALLVEATAHLTDTGSGTPRLDAELLVSHAFGRDRSWLHAHPDAVLDAESAASLRRWVERRAGGEPVAYIRGFKEWFGMRIITDSRALIPRPETELLAEAGIAEIAARLARDSKTVIVWEVGTGSGAIALALAQRFRAALALSRVRLVASDLSPDALELASENLALRGVAPLVTLAVADLMDGFGDGPMMPDVVIANLPYVNRSVVRSAPGSLAYEPSIALDGGPDGLDTIRRLLGQLPNRLAPGGVALLEVGNGQAAAVRELAGALGIRAAITTIPDLAGIDRVVRIARLDA
jgi:release factor glutamine methyltransferase